MTSVAPNPTPPRRVGSYYRLGFLVRLVPDDGPYLQPAPHFLGEVHGHLCGIARSDEILEQRGGHVFGEHAPVPEAPQVELHRLGLQESRSRTVAQLQFVEVWMLGHGANRRQLVRRELDERVGVGVVPRYRV